MPSPFVIRSFEENSYWHVFNRGVDKRKIFLDEDDFKIFKYYLYIYLSPIDAILKIYPQLPLRVQRNNLNDQADLIAYCLMPNHFHFLLGQKSKTAISKLMKQVSNAYTRFFNAKYDRVGSMMQGRFKAVRIKTDEQLVHVSRYIHLNPVSANLVKDLRYYKWSSYNGYINNLEDSFCKNDLIMKLFNSKNDYETFVLNQVDYSKKLESIKHLTIDN